MKILSIWAENCRVHADTRLDFPTEGIIGICGPNETGKSTLVEVLGWLCYGAKAIRKTMGGFRWTRAPETRKAAAGAKLEVRGTVYRVTRSEKEAKVVVLTLAGEAVLAEGQDAVTGFMTELLGMTYDEFMAGRVCGQKDVERIASMKPAPRKEFIRELMGVGRLDEGLEKLRKRKNAISAERDGMAAGLGEREPLADAELRAGTQVKTATATLERMQADVHESSAAATEAAERLQVSDRLRVRHENLWREMTVAEKDLAGVQVAIQSTAGKITTAKAAEQRVAAAADDLARLPALREERSTLREARASADERKALVERIVLLEGDLPGWEAKLLETQATANDYDSSVHGARRKVLDEAIARWNGLREARLAKHAKAVAGADSERAQRDKVRAQIRRVRDLGTDGACPTCLRPLGAALQEVLDTLGEAEGEHERRALAWLNEVEEWGQPSDDEIEAEIAMNDAREIVEAYLEVKRASEQAQKALPDARRHRDQAKATLEKDRARLAELPALPFDAERLAALEATIKELEAKHEALIKDHGLAAQLPDLQAELAAATEREETAKAEVVRLHAALAETPFDPSSHGKIAAEAERLQKLHEDAKVAVARAEEVLSGAQAGLETARRALDEYDRRAALLKDIDRQLALYRRADVVLDNFRTGWVQQIKPEMEELVTGFVNILTDGRHEAVTLTEDFQCTLHQEGVVHEVVSGGTENVSALAMRLAISQMVAERNGDAQGMLWLDEPFDGIDETRRQNVVALIRKLQGVYPQVLVSSHLPDTREAVDHVIELEYDAAAGCSRVVSQPQLAEVA